MSNESCLEVSHLSLNFGGIRALDAVSLKIKRGEIFGVVGPNGAGKTCLLNVINGIYKPQEGNVFLEGKNITGLPSHKVVSLGIGRTFQNVEIFPHMTLLENIMLGCHINMRSNIFTAGMYWGFGQKEEISYRRQVEEIIDFLELERYRKKVADNLSFGVQKMIGIGRALAMNPKIMLLDEPASGMNRGEKEDLARFLLRIKHDLGISMLWVEHDIKLVVDLVDRLGVLNYGKKIAEGTPGDVISSPEVIEAYIGKKQE